MDSKKIEATKSCRAGKRGGYRRD